MNPEDIKYEVVIGLEVHLQLDTKTKVFCGCKNEFGSEPNSNVCPVCLGLPGSLPVVNRLALEYAVKVGLALNCEINSFIKFDRKNYFYPDCPKAYQITQFDLPICSTGHLKIKTEDGAEKTIRINRAHMEEDAGKLIHDSDGSLVDYNRTGTPLLEIVSEADIRSPQETYDYLQTLKLNLQYLNVSDCDMEKGSLRCDANISIRPFGQKEFGTKAELKNMNSFKAVKVALEYEITRQESLIRSGGEVVQETRLWDENKGITQSMRSKEAAHDYRYFPEPDLVPFTMEEDVLNRIRETLPELPEKKISRLMSQYKLNEYDAGVLVSDLNMANYFETCAKISNQYKKICNWIVGPLLQELNSRKLTLKNIPLSAEEMTILITKVEEGILSNLAGKDVLKFALDSGKSIEEIIEEKGLAQVSDDSALEKIVDELIAEHQNIVEQIKGGKENAVGFLVGQAMRKSQGKANPKKIGDMIKRRILNG